MEALIQAGLKEKYSPGDAGMAMVVFNHEYHSVDKDGNQVVYQDRAVRPNTTQAVQALGELTATFSASKESIEIISAEVYLPNGKKVVTDVSQALIKEPFTALNYSDLKIKTISFKGVEEGSVLRVVAKRTFRPDVDKGFFLFQGFFDVLVPTQETLVVLRFEPGTKIAKRERFATPAPTTIRERKTDKGELFYLYGTSEVKPTTPEPVSVPSQETSSSVTFASLATWDEIGRWWSGLYEPKISTSGEVRQKAEELTRDMAKQDDKIKALYDFVKSMRYVSIHLNSGAYLPHPAEETLRNKYGDCKDKAVLLLSLLRSIGVDGAVALVRVPSLITSDLPSPRYFDHAVVALKTPASGYSFLDATAALVPYGLLPETLQHRHALIPRGKGGELVLIPPQPVENNAVEETIEADIHDVHSVTLTSRSRTYSPNQWYHAIPSIPQHLMLEALKEGVAKQYKDFEILKFQFEPADRGGILRNTTTLEIRDFTRKMGQWYIFNPLFDADHLGNESSVGSSTRISDIEFEAPRRLVATATIRLPKTVKVESLPKPMKLVHEKFGSYVYEVQESEGVIKVRREVNISVKRVAAKDFKEFRQFYKASLNQDEELIGLKEL